MKITTLLRQLDSIPNRISMKWMARLVAWAMVAGAIYLYQVEKFGPMILLASGAAVMFRVEFKMVRYRSNDAEEDAAKFGRVALACFIVAIAAAAAVYTTTTY